jgi:hypothetical protein
MNGKPYEEASSTQLVSLAKAVAEPCDVECSAWVADAPGEEWSTGKLVRVAHAQAASEVHFTPTGSLGLEVTLELSPTITPSRAFDLAVRLLAAVTAYDPGLGLKYDPDRSRQEEGRVLIVLTPGPAGAASEARLERVIEIIRSAAHAAGGVTLGATRLVQAA